MTEERKRLRTAASQRIQGIPADRISLALVEVDPADVVAAFGNTPAEAGDEMIRAALLKGSRESNGKPVAVRPDHLLKLLGVESVDSVEVPKLVEG